jgi:hypothetical protein
LGSSTKPKLATILVAVTALAILTRLPQLLSDSLMVDGDESIVGLMALDIQTGSLRSIFFYGQSYGLALFEAAAGSLAFRVAGPSTLALKLAMLGLWIAAVAASVATVRNLGGPRSAVITGLLLVLLPAWGVWSLKARGSYLTAFLFAQLALWLLSRLRPDEQPRTAFEALAVGVCLAIVYFAQPLWLPALLPLVFYLGRRLRVRGASVAAIGAAGATAAVVFLGHGTNSAWSPPVLGGTDLFAAAADLAFRLRDALGGAYYLGHTVHTGPFRSVSGWLGVLLTLLISIAALRDVALRDATGSRRFTPVAACVSGIWLSLAATLWIDPQDFAHRYLLPVPALLAMAIGLSAAPLARPDAWPRRAIAVVSVLGMLAGIGTLFEFSRLTYDGLARRGETSEQQLMANLLSELANAGVTHVYCSDPNL